MTRVTLVGVDATVCTVRTAAGFLLDERCRDQEARMSMHKNGRRTGACWTTIFLMKRSSSSRFFASAFDSAFFKRRRTNLTDFSGQRPNHDFELGESMLRYPDMTHPESP